MTGLLLSIAIASEVAATLALKVSDGLSRPLPAAVVVVGYALSFWMLALVLKHLSVGTTYAVWSAAGTAAIATIGMLAHGETANALKLVSLGLIVIGVVGLNASGAH
jgi:small multidrug resistance pump